MSVTYSQDQEISASDGQLGDYFGYSLALSTHGHMAFVGAPFDNISASDQGSVYFFLSSSDQWIFQQKLFLNSGTTSDQFGSAIAVSADSSTLLVGVPQPLTNTAGKVCVYTNSDNTWIKQTTLSASNSDGWFGSSLALSEDGNIVAIGAPQYGTAAGLVHIFNRITSNLGTVWIHQKQIPSPNGNNQLFGSSLSLSADGSVLLVGAVGGSNGYIFVNSDNTWIQQSAVLGNGISDAFGTSVALSFVGDIALVGAPNHNSNQGAAYIYVYSDATWSAQIPLPLPSDVSAGNQFGSSVALGLGEDGATTAIIGAPGANKTYIVKSSKNTWTKFQEISISDATSVSFGNAVALSGNGRIGFIADSGFSSDLGTGYLFSIPTVITLAETNSLISYLPQTFLALVLLYSAISIIFLVTITQA